jgi:type IV fimbrial biogenesis protein FimT
MQQQRGFTFLELIITVGIIGIASMLAVSSMSSLMGSSSGEDYAKGLSKSINFSRIQAVSTGQTVTMCPIVEGICANLWTNDITIFVDTANNRTLGGNAVLKIIEAIPSKDDLTYTGTALGISFYPDGSIGDDDNGVFSYLQNKACDGNVKGVDVNNSGRARFIASPSCN